MLKLVFTIYDTKAKTYRNPMVADTRGDFMRSLQDVVNEPDTLFNKHPTDFSLFELGQFDTETGTFVLSKSPEYKCQMLELKRESIPNTTIAETHSPLEDSITTPEVLNQAT